MRPLERAAREFLTSKIEAALQVRDKMKRYEAYSAATAEAKLKFVETETDKEMQKKREKELSTLIEDLKYKLSREMVLSKKTRIDGRRPH